MDNVLFTMKMSEDMRVYLAALCESLGTSSAEYIRRLILEDAGERVMYKYFAEREEDVNRQ